MILLKLVLGIICKVCATFTHTAGSTDPSREGGPSPIPRCLDLQWPCPWPGEELEKPQILLLLLGAELCSQLALYNFLIL